jgi:hypothetical protein
MPNTYQVVGHGRVRILTKEADGDEAISILEREKERERERERERRGLGNMGALS